MEAGKNRGTYSTSAPRAMRPSQEETGRATPSVKGQWRRSSAAFEKEIMDNDTTAPEKSRVSRIHVGRVFNLGKGLE